MTPVDLEVRKTASNELEDFLSILREAALWLKQGGREMWSDSQLSAERLLKHHSLDDMYIGYCNGEAAAAMILQEEDAMLWPDLEQKDSLFVHKLAVRRKYAKQGVSEHMMNWAKAHAERAGKDWIRLDCAADRPKLCQFYEKQGFKRVRERVVLGKYPTAFYEFRIVTT